MTDPAAGVAELMVARAADDRVALVAGDERWTWREVVSEAAARAVWLRGRLDPSVPPNVGLLLDNTPDFVFTLFAAALTGSCVVGINPTRRGAELARDIAHTDCQFVLSDLAHSDLLRDAIGIQLELVEAAPWKASLGAPLPELMPAADSLLLLIFTSGSTAAPKAVKRSSQGIARAAPIGFGPDDALYCSMPLIHGNALFGCLFPALAGGSRIVLRERFSAHHWLDDVRRYDATFATSVGRALSYVLATPPSDLDRDHRLAAVLAPETSPRDAAAFTERFGVPVITGYGSSEGGITLLPSRRHGALGRAPAGTSIAVVDSSSGREQEAADIDEDGLLRNPEAAIGELVRRDAVGAFEGYWRNPAADAERLHDGWFYSGDLAYRDADGVFFFAGRVGDWIRVDAENFAAAPVERIIERFPGFDAAAVVAVPDAHSGDRVLACVEVGDPDRFDPASFTAWLAEQPDLGTKWAPTILRACRGLPTVGHDKIDRRRLQREAWLTDDPVWWRPARDAGFARMDGSDQNGIRAAFAANGRAALHPPGAPR